VWTTLRHILEMIRFSHTLFALPFALLAAVMAWSTPAPAGHAVAFRPIHLAGILICMVCARSAAMAFNRIVDRRLDAANPRTSTRHLPAGILSVGSVAWFTAACSAGFVAGTLLFLPNRLPLYLSLPVLLFLLAYSYTKRFTSLAHFWLGAALMLAPVGVWVALRGTVLEAVPADILPAIVLGAVVLLWVAGFDIIYACQDADYDRKAHLHSLPARWGIVGALRAAAACHAGMVLALIALPFSSPQLELGAIYGAGVAAVALLLVYEHRLLRPDDLSRVNVAFFHVNWVVSLALLLAGSLDLLL
jgi:4-hydroxybenzoate polyprenyltransferase